MRRRGLPITSSLLLITLITPSVLPYGKTSPLKGEIKVLLIYFNNIIIYHNRAVRRPFSLYADTCPLYSSANSILQAEYCSLRSGRISPIFISAQPVRDFSLFTPSTITL